LWWPFVIRSRIELQFHPTPGSKRSANISAKMYQCRCTAKNSWWWARLPKTCRFVIPIEFYSLGTVINFKTTLNSAPSQCTNTPYTLVILLLEVLNLYFILPNVILPISLPRISLIWFRTKIIGNKMLTSYALSVGESYSWRHVSCVIDIPGCW
jgi:hypothetical protein